MSIEQYANNPVGVLNGAITNVATTLVITSIGNFPTTGNYRIKIDSEYLLVTGVSGTTLTVTRGIEGSSATSHADQAAIYGVLTAGALQNLFTTNDNLFTDTDGSTITFDISKAGRRHLVVLGGNRTLALSGDNTGCIFTIILQQDGTGSRTVTWWSNIKWSGGTGPTLSTTANYYDVFNFVKIDSTHYLGVQSMSGCH